MTSHGGFGRDRRREPAGSGRRGAWWVAALGVVLLAPALHAQEPVHVSAALSRTRVAAGETAQLDVTVRTDGSEPDDWRVPALPSGLAVVGSSDRTQLSFSLPGGRAYTMTRSYYLSATGPGTYRIPAVNVVVDGVTYRTRPLTLVVTASAPGYASEPGVRSAPGVDFDARMRPDTVYVGQQATLEAEARFSGDLRQRMSWAPEYVPPNPAGFWVQDLTDAAAVRTRVTTGGVTEVHSYRRAYFPLEAGDYRLPPAHLSYDLRAGLFGQNVPRELVSDSIPLHVRQLPSSGRPGSFTGAVGDYTLRATLEPATVPVGESAVLQVEITGTGNVRALPAPQLTTPDGVQVYPPTEDARVHDDGGIVGGTKTFSWVLVPQHPGPMSVGPVEYGVFRPDRRRYVVLRSGVLELRATPATGVTGGAAATPTLSPLRRTPSEGGLDWVLSPWFAALQLLPLLAALGLYARRRPRAGPRPPSRRALEVRRRHEIQALRADAQRGDREFYVRLEQVLTGWLADRLAAPGLRTGVPERVQRELRAAGVAEAHVERVLHVLRRIEAARFAPADGGAGERLALVATLDSALQAVDEAAPAPARRHGHAATASVIGAVGLALLAGTAGTAGAVQPRVTPFQNGVSAYSAGRFGDARDSFALAVKDDARDAAAWYDLGLSAMRAGRRGEAVLAWLHALRLRPRDADARANLDAAGVDPALVRRVVPLLPLTMEESLLLTSLLWLVGGGLIVVRLARRRGGWLVGGAAVAIAAAMLVAGAMLAPRLLSPTAIVLSAKTELRPAPDLRSGVISQLQEGEALSIGERRDAWLRVRTQDGRDGWVEERDVGSL